jgi:hypothetical protein
VAVCKGAGVIDGGETGVSVFVGANVEVGTCGEGESAVLISVGGNSGIEVAVKTRVCAGTIASELEQPDR